MRDNKFLPKDYEDRLERILESELILLRHLFFPTTPDDDVLVNRDKMVVLVRPSVLDKSERLYTIEGTRELVLDLNGTKRKVVARKISDDFFSFYL